MGKCGWEHFMMTVMHAFIVDKNVSIYEDLYFRISVVNQIVVSRR